MQIRVLFFAAIRETLGKSQLDLEIPEGSTAGDLRSRLVREYPALSTLPFYLAKNRSYTELQDALKDGDELALLPPVSGG